MADSSSLRHRNSNTHFHTAQSCCHQSPKSLHNFSFNKSRPGVRCVNVPSGQGRQERYSARLCIFPQRIAPHTARGTPSPRPYGKRGGNRGGCFPGVAALGYSCYALQGWCESQWTLVHTPEYHHGLDPFFLLGSARNGRELNVHFQKDISEEIDCWCRRGC
jgi:hypothetical protein